MTANKTGSQLVWISGESDEMVSGKYARRALEILSRHDRLNETSTKSRTAGIAIQYVIPPESVQQWENSVDERLAESDIPQATLDKTQLPRKNKNLAEYFGTHHAEFVDEHEFADIDNSMFKITLPERLLSDLDDALDDDPTYNLRQKSMFVSNAILAWDSSPFSDCLDRVRTKEQLLKASRGEDVENPTDAFQLIENSELWKGLRPVVEQAGANTGDVTDIEPEDEVVLEEDEEPVWEELPQSPSARLGPFLAVLRRLANRGGDGFAKQNIVQIFEMANSDYQTPEMFVDSYVLDYLHRGPEGEWYVDEDEVPEVMTAEEEKEAIIDDIGIARESRKNSKNLADVCENKLGLENVVAASKLKPFADELKKEALRDILEEMIKGLPTKKGYRESVVEDMETEDAGNW